MRLYFVLMKKGLELFVLIMVILLVYSSFNVYGFDAPTNAAFEVVGAGNVNTHTGDMSLSIPLMTVPGISGTDYPITLSYASGIKLDQKSGPVGLGWSLGIPSISRGVVGVPDDYFPTDFQSQDKENVFYYDKVTNYDSYYSYSTIKHSGGFSLGLQIAGLVGSLALSPFTGGTSLLFNGVVSGASVGSAVATGIGAVQSVRGIYNTAHGYNTHEIVSHLIEIHNTPQNIAAKGFYWLGLNDVITDPKEVLDYHSPDNFVMNSPIYSGPLSYGVKGVSAERPYLLHAAVASGNVKDRESTLATCSDTNYADCEDSLKISIYTNENFGDGVEDYHFERFTVVDTSGTIYTFKPTVMFDGSDTTYSEGSMRELGYSLTDPSSETELAKFASYYRTSVRPNTCDTGYRCYESNGNCQFGIDGDYQERAFLTPYYAEWGISEIRSVYEGQNNAVYGDWSIKFDWDDWGSLYQQRNPDGYTYHGNHQDSWCLEKPDGSMGWSESFVKYKLLRKIRTKTHEAEFFYGDREDNLEASGGSATNDGDSPTKKLERIELREIDSAEILQEVRFSYDYNLFRQNAFADGLPNNEPGRLTLRSVQVCGRGGCDAGLAMPPYEFGYYGEDMGDQDTPPYRPFSFDRWGYYYGYGAKHDHNSEGADYSNNMPYLFSLTKIRWPNGGTTEYGYESDRYVNVNNYYADPSPGIQKTDSRYGGGLRVSEVITCDGLEDELGEEDHCVMTKYLYVNDIIDYDFQNGEIDGFWDPQESGESSGVAISEPGSYSGIDDGLIPYMGNPYSQQYVGYSNVYEIPGYNEGASDLENIAPYGYKKHEYFTSATLSEDNPDDPYEYADHGYYEPPILFEHPVGDGGSGYWYGFSFPKSREIEEIDGSDRFYTIPINTPVLVFGPKDHTLRFIFKISLDKTYRPEDDPAPHDGEFGNRYMYVDVDLPATQEESKCNVNSNAYPNGFVCKSFTFSRGIVSASTHSNNFEIGRAMCDDGYGCNAQWGNIRGVVYDITSGDDDYMDGNGMENSHKPKNVEEPIFKFVWPKGRTISCRDDTLEDCYCDESHNHIIPDAYYRMMMGTSGEHDLNKLNFDEDFDDCVSDDYSPVYPEFYHLACQDRDYDGECDWIDNDYVDDDFDVEYRYASSLSRDFMRGSLKSEEVYNSKSELISYLYPGYNPVYRVPILQTGIVGDGLRLPIVWGVKTNDTVMQDNKITVTKYEYNDVSGLFNRLETTNSDGDKLITKTEFAGLLDPVMKQYTHEWDKVFSITTYEGSDVPANQKTKTEVYWDKLYDQHNYEDENWMGGHVKSYETVWQDSPTDHTEEVVRYLDYDKFARPYHIFNYMTFDEDSQQHIGTHTYNWYGDADHPCLDNNPRSRDEPYGDSYDDYSGYNHAYLTCTQSCMYFDNDGNIENDEDCELDDSKLIISKAQYNELGEIVSIVDENNQETRYEYDDLWRLEKVAPPGLTIDEPAISYDYYYALVGGSEIDEDNLNYVKTNTHMYEYGNDNKKIESNALADGLGRTKETRLIDEGDTTLFSTSTYNKISLPETVSKLEQGEFLGGGYRSPSGRKGGGVFDWLLKFLGYREETPVTTTLYADDPFGRVKFQYPFGEDPDDPSGVYIESKYGGTEDYSYIQIIDENGVPVTSYTDRFGNVVEVDANNLILNPGFEMWVEADKPDYWNGGGILPNVEPGIGNTVSVKNTIGNCGGNGDLYQDIEIDPEAVYFVSAFAKGVTDGDINGKIAILLFDNNWNPLHPYDGGSGNECDTRGCGYSEDCHTLVIDPNVEDYTRESCWFQTADPDTAYARVIVDGIGSGDCNDVLFDNVQLEKSMITRGDGTPFSAVYNEYDILGRLINSETIIASRENPNGEVLETSYEYDALGRVSWREDPDRGRICYTYYDNGLIKTVLEDYHDDDCSWDYAGGGGIPNDAMLYYEYDALGRNTKVCDIHDDGIENCDNRVVLESIYDSDVGGRCQGCTNGFGNGKLCRVIDREYGNNEICYSYDEGGRVVSTTQFYEHTQYGEEAAEITSFTTSYEYDRTGVLKKTIVQGNELTMEMDYNKLGQVEYYYINGEEVDNVQRQIDYTYTEQGLVDQIDYPNQVKTDFNYDPDRDWINEISHGFDQGSDKFFHETYEYDYLNYNTVGNLYSITDNLDGGSSVYFSYDSLYRLLYVDDMGYYGTGIRYDYDELGNRLSRTVTPGIPGVVGDDTYTYELETNKLFSTSDCESITYYPNGNIDEKFCGSLRTKYYYDYANRLRSITIHENDALRFTFNFEYDALGRRIYKFEKDWEVYPNLEEGIETWYYYGLGNTPLLVNVRENT